MFTTRLNLRTFRHNEVLWLVIAALIVLLILALARGTSPALGQTRGDGPPKLLPEITTAWSGAVTHYRAGRVVETAVALETISCDLNRGRNIVGGNDNGLMVWNVLTAHRMGDFDRVIGPWKEVPLAPGMSGYRRVALAAIYLEKGDLENAGIEINAAREALPNSPVVHYYAALYRLGQAAGSRDWPDCIGPSNIQLASYERSERPIMTASAYELAAANELHEALELNATFNRYAPLLLDGDTAEPGLRPTVNDLLLALGADRWEGNAHNMLGVHYLARGTASEAETHLDAAVKNGANVLYGYQDLANLYEGQGRFAEAARADLKALATSPAKASATRDFFRHVRDGLWEN